MIVYVGRGTGPLRDRIIAAGHGQLVSRQADGFRIPKKGRWVFDNGAFIDWKHGRPFDGGEFLRRLDRIYELPRDRWPDWCVVPDLVADPRSLEYSIEWRTKLRFKFNEFRWYLALQDWVFEGGIDEAFIEERFDGLFIGGSTDWKHRYAEHWVYEGHSRYGVPVHLARVNGPRLLQWAINIGADSVDGTGWVRAGERWIHLLEKLPRFDPSFIETVDPAVRGKDTIDAELEYLAAYKAYDPEAISFERAARLRAMSHREFVEWLAEVYGVDVSSYREDPNESEEWAWRWGLWTTFEAAQGPKPVPETTEA
jgi:predicted HTH domain antitoxin